MIEVQTKENAKCTREKEKREKPSLLPGYSVGSRVPPGTYEVRPINHSAVCVLLGKCGNWWKQE
ncbi:predicted protein [Sclerotinia sclerotiorum 1980 UF-70]|uniref:Uncharacterized protein n=1 Tax=Sclerotinia sclerotiorum (strain ATCC 18683 / 1980 / Ss-1) TaxID=665079 RepID=A7EIH6_SCLS1|nr:predicted protein [Sclerotinia sclerotiorum 1980 UF-70]EDO02642.1 predicted protein [Sclerotinia sclerotiorum 1980 UF-70]